MRPKAAHQLSRYLLTPQGFWRDLSFELGRALLVFPKLGVASKIRRLLSSADLMPNTAWFQRIGPHFNYTPIAVSKSSLNSSVEQWRGFVEVQLSFAACVASDEIISRVIPISPKFWGIPIFKLRSRKNSAGSASVS